MTIRFAATRLRALMTTMAISSLLALAGCSAQAKEQLTIAAGDRELANASINSHGQWESAPWSGTEWIPLSGGGIVTVSHPLGHKPILLLPYLSFDRNDGAAGTRRAFPGAGDVANIYNISDKSVTVENRSGADFYLRLVLE